MSFPVGRSAGNRVICLSGVGAQNDFSAIMTDCVPDLHTIQTGQCFPRYLYEGEVKPANNPQGGLFAATLATQGGRRDAITDEGLAHFEAAYSGETITKDGHGFGREL